MRSASAWSSVESVNEFSTTSAPAFPSSSATPSPIPEFEPVMTAVLPFSDIATFLESRSTMPPRRPRTPPRANWTFGHGVGQKNAPHRTRCAGECLKQALGSLPGAAPFVLAAVTPLRGERVSIRRFELDPQRAPVVAAGFLAVARPSRVVFDPPSLENRIADELAQQPAAVGGVFTFELAGDTAHFQDAVVFRVPDTEDFDARRFAGRVGSRHAHGQLDAPVPGPACGRVVAGHGPRFSKRLQRHAILREPGIIDQIVGHGARAEERRVGKECVST